MGFDQNSVSDYALAFVPALLFLATCSTVFHRLKVRWPVKVNCWFCNENTKIPRQNRNWWLCPWCEQYNGFSKNGDYARNIPEQYTSSGANPVYCRLLKQKNNMYKIPKSDLCEHCNKQESLKLIELSNFEPRNRKLHNDELKAFKEYLEERYPLCKNCKLTVYDVLHKQALWLAAYKMSFFRKKPVQMLIKNARKIEITFRVTSIILDLIIIYNLDFPWLAISGLLSHLCACWTSSLRKKNFDILLIVLWICISILLSVKNLTTFENVWFPSKYINEYHMILVCAFIGILSIKPSQYKNRFVSVKFKKLTHKLHSQSIALSQSKFKNQNTNDSIWNETNNSVELTNKLSFSKIQSYSIMNNPQNDYCLNESMSTLFLSEDFSTTRCNKENAKTAPTIFEKRTYSATSSESLFKKSSVSNNRKYILSPPKLKSVTQTSWVAGGYWQEGMPTTPTTLSRSSSQSSGFGSAGSSNLASSREPSSVHELDRCSVVSNATRLSCHVVSRSTVPFHVQSQREGACDYSRRAICKTDIQESESSAENRGDSTLVVPGHTTTIITSPGWLSVLLCGSLIVNIIVLCAMLLR
ncbi:uncharacterized protein LOC109858542 isoform X2 [Pseudomyrmex gracilis]|uniref:uncharacterized protein LOC109858542 isoform X2 n=1 Tax=Pseudomyrmex gracilis TaxID=219809 RepID=UPI00099562C0|nr:uncharacterized protein LOC109858542 isoform X2 [Pseudomyrmex gracilis]